MRSSVLSLRRRRCTARWADDGPAFIKRRNLIQKKYLNEAKKSTKKTVDDEKVTDEKSDGPKFSEWATVATVKAKDFDSA